MTFWITWETKGEYEMKLDRIELKPDEIKIKYNRVERRKLIKQMKAKAGKKRHWMNTNPQMLRKEASGK
jgi:hypothetical protein